MVVLVGIFVQQYHEYSFTPEGYLRGVFNPKYLVGIGLIIVSILLFSVGFFCIVKEKIRTGG
jgi:hypothetical protein